VQIEGFSANESGLGDQEFLMDEMGNIYDLNGNFVATMGNDEEDDEAISQADQNQLQSNY